jgi:uncharacterized protein (DUF305 family)
MRLTLALALILGAVVPATVMAEDMKMDMPMPQAGKTTAADKALQDSMSGMMTSMNAPLSGNADRDFAAMMLPHHEGAVAMAKVELQYGHDPELRRLATDIVDSQAKEIDFMQKWLAAHQ